MAKRRGLGRGLGALISEAPEPAAPEASGVRQLPADSLRPSEWQPRRAFESRALAELADSVRQKGVLQPLLVRASGSDGYEIVAGERRYRAALEAGLSTLPAIVIEAGDQEAMELALIENLQREDLGPLEEAEAYRVLMDRFDLTQEALAARVGKPRASVANALRLLDLPGEVRELLAAGALSAGHAKLLSSLDAPAEQVSLARRAAAEGWSVRRLEKHLHRTRRARRRPRSAASDLPESHLSLLSERLHDHFGTSVAITPSRTYANGRKAHGSIQIDFYSNEDLDRLLDLWGVDLNA